jgi:DNA-binding transcriptional ArsR family regulator
MSHVATNWAFQQRGLTPIAFRILANLADCHNPANGCFPSQAWLAERCEVHRASINRHLAELEDKGLICRERRQDAGSKQQRSTRYYLGFETDFASIVAQFRVADSDTAAPQSHVADCDTDPGGKPGEGRVAEMGGAVSHSSATVTCKEPINPLPPEISFALEGLVHIWPNDKQGDLARCRAALGDMTDDMRGKAVRLAKDVLVGMVRLKRPVPKLHRYLEGRVFAEFDGAPEIDADGRFVITPEREEWSAWLGDIRRQFGQRGVDSAVKGRRYLPPTRWPEGHPNAARTAP